MSRTQSQACLSYAEAMVFLGKAKERLAPPPREGDGEQTANQRCLPFPLVKGARGMFRLFGFLSQHQSMFTYPMEHPPAPLHKGESYYMDYSLFTKVG